MLRKFFGMSKKNSSKMRLKDPICSMEATDKVTFEYKGQVYFFCSDHCRGQFEKEPERYIIA